MIEAQKTRVSAFIRKGALAEKGDSAEIPSVSFNRSELVCRKIYGRLSQLFVECYHSDAKRIFVS